MATQSELDREAAARAPMPGSVRVALAVAVVLLMAGALYLISVRGSALLLDLSALARSCFY